MPEQLDLIEWINGIPDTMFGTPPHKLVRHIGPKTSIDAACKVITSKREKMVYEAIQSFGAQGCIIDQVRAIYPNLPYSTITARPAALIEKGLIIDTGAEKKGNSGAMQRVLRAVEF